VTLKNLTEQSNKLLSQHGAAHEQRAISFLFTYRFINFAYDLKDHSFHPIRFSVEGKKPAQLKSMSYSASVREFMRLKFGIC